MNAVISIAHCTLPISCCLMPLQHLRAGRKVLCSTACLFNPLEPKKGKSGKKDIFLKNSSADSRADFVKNKKI